MRIFPQKGVVGSHNGLSVVLWRNTSIESQGYMVEHNKLY